MTPGRRPTRAQVVEGLADALLILAVASIGVGCWLIAPALAFVVVGVLFGVLAAALQLDAFRRGDDARE
jgi:hypothetical protein